MSVPRLIPEFSPQSGVMITWPHVDSDWRDSLGHIEPVYLEIMHAISRYERVLVICHDNKHIRHVSNLLEQGVATTAAVRCVAVNTNDTWVRD